ncbi:TonB-dependent receptor plug domain-containing protein [Sulfuricurvum sp.]|uniref:TonB-dependent receptor plug domain-containing protein n=1 Tax=Sulfuricurvum sp. TaxID=2025608 RepID=UPI002D372641|nr:TonB-dependent receptor plug domain-containing protein [Sulfuricurvum sp.]HZF71469.1 TonB-dependent receptor plug domain-containing protein [Sulfuricurvum sp.]
MATSINQNIDYQPFILSVLKGSDLIKFGVKTLGDALTLVPGVDMGTNTMNNRTTIFRGSNPTAYGQSVLVIDGVVLNDTIFSNYNPYLDMPIELIDRIEVVRGSGSFIDGVNGYAGTINVVTHEHADTLSTQNGSLFGYAGSSNAIGGGGWSRYKGDNWKLSLDAFAQHNDNKTPIAVKDSLPSSLSPDDYARLGMIQSGVGATYTYNNFEIQGRINQFKSDSAFGNLNVIPNPDGTIKQPSWYIQGKYTLPLSSDTDITFKTSLTENSWESNSRPLPPGTVIGSTTFLDGYWASLMVKFRRIDGSAILHYNGIDSHHITAGFESSWDKAINMQSITTNKDTGVGLVDYSNTSRAFIDTTNAKRQSTNFYLADQIDINEHIALALTLGTINTSDITSENYGRTSLVYQPDYSNIFKLMAGTGYRYPSAQEMYVTPSPYATGNPNLTPEHVNSIEGQYLRKLSTNLTAGINLFYLKNTKQIVRDTTGTFQNTGDNVIHGGETELRGKITPEDTLSLSYSYIHGKVSDHSSGTESTLPYAASHLIKAAYSYDFISGLTLSGIWNYVGSKKRYINDTRSDLSAYNTLDLAIGWNMNESKGWYAQAIIKNIGDTIVRYPAPVSTYHDDYPISDRSFWIRAGWKF